MTVYLTTVMDLNMNVIKPQEFEGDPSNSEVQCIFLFVTSPSARHGQQPLTYNEAGMLD